MYCLNFTNSPSLPSPFLPMPYSPLARVNSNSLFSCLSPSQNLPQLSKFPFCPFTSSSQCLTQNLFNPLTLPHNQSHAGQFLVRSGSSQHRNMIIPFKQYTQSLLQPWPPTTCDIYTQPIDPRGTNNPRGLVHNYISCIHRFLYMDKGSVLLSCTTYTSVCSVTHYSSKMYLPTPQYFAISRHIISQPPTHYRYDIQPTHTSLPVFNPLVVIMFAHWTRG